MCHQSVGLFARAIEEAGIPTIMLSAALDITSSVKPPRAVFVNFPLGHQAGKPCDPEGQTRILLDALQVLETATTPGTLVQLPYKWDESDPLDSWEAEEMLHPSLM